MKRRAALLLGLALPVAALAQGTPRTAELDQLFAVLRDSQDAAQLALAEARIRQICIKILNRLFRQACIQIARAALQ